MVNKSKETELKKLAAYGLGCAAFKLDGERLSAFFSCATGRAPMNEGLIKATIPRAYQAVIERRRNCRNYFLASHNNRLLLRKGAMAERLDPNGIRFCLVREGALLTLEEATGEDKVFFEKLLGKSFADNIGKTGVVHLPDGSGELVVMDTLPEAKVGDVILIHRNIAAEIV